jgi:hypothetical protein
MDPASLSALVSDLFVVIHALSGYPPPSVPPEIQLVSQSVMQAEICGAPCPIRAYYHPTRGVFIDETLDVANDPFARSILLHELVHYVQAASGRFDSTLDPCVRYNAAEAEAYMIQNHYLMRINDTHRVAMSGWAMMRCRPAEVSTAR